MFPVVQHKYHTKIDEQIEKISGQMSKDVVGKLVQVMEKTLSKLATFDEGSMMGSMLGFVVSITIITITIIIMAKHGHIFANSISQKIDMSPSRTRKSM